jgi:hypothetical protein
MKRIFANLVLKSLSGTAVSQSTRETRTDWDEPVILNEVSLSFMPSPNTHRDYEAGLAIVTVFTQSSLHYAFEAAKQAKEILRRVGRRMSSGGLTLRKTKVYAHSRCQTRCTPYCPPAFPVHSSP